MTSGVDRNSYLLVALETAALLWSRCAECSRSARSLRRVSAVSTSASGRCLRGRGRRNRG